MSIFSPTDFESEQGVIGCCVLGGRDIASAVIEALPDDSFNHPLFREAWAVLKELVSDGKEITDYTFNTTYHERFGPGIPVEVNSAVDMVPSALNWPYYAEQLLASYKNRCLQQAGAELSLASVDGQVSPEQVLLKAQEIVAGATKSKHRFLNSKESAKALVDDLEARYDRHNKGEHSGLLTGFVDLDRLTDGLQIGEQFIIGARPSQGKTALGLNLIEYLAIKCGVPSLIFTCEMSAEALLRRLVASFGRIPLANLKTGSLSREDATKLPGVTRAIQEAPLRIVDCVNGITIDELEVKARAQARLHGVKLVVIDYLQKIHPTKEREKRTYEVGEVSQRLKALASTAGVALVTLAQLNREPDRDKGRLPRVSDLADSSQIERDADAIALLHRLKTDDDPQAQNALLILAKQRDGETGNIRLHFRPDCVRFENSTAHEEPRGASSKNAG